MNTPAKRATPISCVAANRWTLVIWLPSWRESNTRPLNELSKVHEVGTLATEVRFLTASLVVFD
jgi:hypothetical protein